MSLLPVKHNFKIIPGATFHYRFKWAVEEGEGLKGKDVEGYIGTMPIVFGTPSVNWMTLTQEINGSGTGLVFGPNGLIDIIISSEDTEAIIKEEKPIWTVASFKLLVNQKSAESIPLIAGKFTVLPTK